MTMHTTSTTAFDRAVIFHGYSATPADHWFGWLAAQLDAAGIPATVPTLPDPLEPEPGRWDDAVRAAVGVPDERTVLVAHSLGCLSVLRSLRSLPGTWRLGALILVSGFVDPLPALPELDAFIGDGPDVSGRADRIDRVVVVRSDDDTLVPPEHTDRLASLFHTQARVVAGVGHFLAADGVTELPVVRDAIIGESATRRRAAATTPATASRGRVCG